MSGGVVVGFGDVHDRSPCGMVSLLRARVHVDPLMWMLASGFEPPGAVLSQLVRSLSPAASVVLGRARISDLAWLRSPLATFQLVDEVTLTIWVARTEPMPTITVHRNVAAMRTSSTAKPWSSRFGADFPGRRTPRSARSIPSTCRAACPKPLLRQVVSARVSWRFTGLWPNPGELLGYPGPAVYARAGRVGAAQGPSGALRAPPGLPRTGVRPRCPAGPSGGRGVARRQRHRLLLEEELEAFAPELPPQARLLVAPEGGGEVDGDGTVEHVGAGAHSPGHGQAAVGVTRPHRTAQPIARVVGHRHGLLVPAVVGDHGQHRPEDLLLGDAHRVVHVDEQGGLDEPALVDAGRSASSEGHLGALFLADLDVALNPVPLT